MPFEIPPFRPHALLRGGHAQTLAGAYLPSRPNRYSAIQQRVALADGDQIVLHDDCPANWQRGGRTVLMLHGLAGSHESGYMRRISSKLTARGVRAFRMDLRGSGAGMTLARLPYHSGRSEDAAAAIEAIAELAPDSPLTLVGFSLGANIVLKLLGELAGRACGQLDSAVAVCPPADLAACSRRISAASNRHYDRYFVKLLLGQLAIRRAALPSAADLPTTRRPRTLWEFDDYFTAPVCGFGRAEEYYRQASSLGLIGQIETPTLIVAAHDDPMIPSDSLAAIVAPPAVHIHLADSGGHLGFVGRKGMDADRRWMDWRVVDWVLSRASEQEHIGQASRPGPASTHTS